MANETTDYTSYDYITKKSEDYLSMSSNSLLNKARLQYDSQYDSAIYNAHKFLQSACTHCASVLDKTTETIQAKGELLKNGIDIFVHTPEPEPQAIGNTALVVPKLTAESDLQSRYETPQGSESSGSNTNNNGGSGNLIKGTGPVNCSDNDLNALIACIAAEGGGNSYEFKLAVASVIVNRVADSDFPNTIYDVILAPSQYEGAGSSEWWAGSGRLTDDCEKAAREIVNNGSQLPSNVVFQAMFVQGSGVYMELEGNYFCYK